MKKAVLRLFIPLVIFGGAQCQFVRPEDYQEVHAHVYYVAKDGNDSWEGSLEHPWLTIQKAADTMAAGDTVYIKEGIYTERIVPQQSGFPEKFITYMAYPGHKSIVDAAGNGTVFGIIGKSYIRIDSLDMRNAGNWGILIEDSTNIEIRNAKVSHSRLENIQIRGESSQIVVEDCEMSYSHRYSGIDIYQYGGRPHDVTVKNCIAHHNQQFAGIASEQADSLLIDSNICYSNRLGIDIGSGDRNVVRNNTIYDCETGIALSSNEDSEVYENIIYAIKNEAIYGYCFSVNGEAHARNKWYRNIIHNCGFGIYESKWDRKGNEGASSDHEFYKNLFYEIGTHGAYRAPFYFQGPTGIKFHNNTIYVNPNYDAIQLREGAINSRIENNIISISGNRSPIIMDSSSTAGSVVDYNCYQNRRRIVTGPGAHSIGKEPKFVDVENRDFHLQLDSPCKGAGKNGVDMGAYGW